MPIFYSDSGSIDDLVVDTGLNATGSLFGTSSYVNTATLANSFNLLVSASAVSTNISQLVFSNANSVTFGLNGSTITATADFGANITLPYFNPKDKYQQVLGSWGNNTLFMQPFQCQAVQFDRVAIPVYISNADNANSTMGLSMTMRWGLYTRNISTLSLLTNYTVSTTFQDTLGSANSSLYRGIRLWTLGLTQTLTEGQYYVGMLSSVTNTRGTINNIVISQQASSFFGLFGQPYSLTAQYTRGLGFYTATTSNFPSSIAISELNGAATYTTANASATNVLRPPIFYVVSQTF